MCEARRSTSPTAVAPRGDARPCVRRDTKVAPAAGLLLVAEKFVCAVVAAPTAAPASVMIDCRCVQLHRWNIGRVSWWFDALLKSFVIVHSGCPPGRKTCGEETLGFDDGHGMCVDGCVG